MTDSTTPQDAAAMSPASAGSVAERPLGDPEIAVEILRLRVAELEQAIRRLADQDATLSVVSGNVIVEMDATLTDAERTLIEKLTWESEHPKMGRSIWVIPQDRETARGLLQRLK